MLRRSAISFLLVLVGISARGSTRPQYGGTLRVEIAGDQWQSNGGLARRLVMDGLTRMDRSGYVQAALATEWKSENDYRRWHFTLRPGVLLQNSQPLTSEMVGKSLSRSCQTVCPWTAIQSMDSSIEFTSDSSLPNLPEILASDNYLIGFDSDRTGIVGTGPFELTGEAVNDGVQRFVANENCWQGRPFLDEVDIHSHRSVRDQWLDLSVGRADVVEVPPEEIRLAQQQHMTVLASSPVDLLALEISANGALANQSLRAAISLAIDRAALFNVIFQKQGEITASILPQELSGYAFLFPAERDLAKAQELRGGVKPPTLSLGFEGAGSMQLAAQRIALNLHEAGFDVQVTGAPHADLMLRSIPFASTDPAAALASVLRAAGETTPLAATSPTAVYRAEHDFLDRKTLVPLLDLPRACAVGTRVRDLTLGGNGAPDFAGAWLEAVP